MTDLEITRLCAEAIGYDCKQYTEQIYARDESGIRLFDPLHDDAQAMALVKKFGLNIWSGPGSWRVMGGETGDEGDTWNVDLNRAICECVAKMQAAK